MAFQNSVSNSWGTILFVGIYLCRTRYIPRAKKIIIQNPKHRSSVAFCLQSGFNLTIHRKALAQTVMSLGNSPSPSDSYSDAW